MNGDLRSTSNLFPQWQQPYQPAPGTKCGWEPRPGEESDRICWWEEKLSGPLELVNFLIWHSCDYTSEERLHWNVLLFCGLVFIYLFKKILTLRDFVIINISIQKKHFLKAAMWHEDNRTITIWPFLLLITKMTPEICLLWTEWWRMWASGTTVRHQLWVNLKSLSLIPCVLSSPPRNKERLLRFTLSLPAVGLREQNQDPGGEMYHGYTVT